MSGQPAQMGVGELRVNNYIGMEAIAATPSASASIGQVYVVGNATLIYQNTGGSTTLAGNGQGLALSAGVSNLGNTGGTTGLVSRQVVYVGGNNVTLSESVNGQSASISIIVMGITGQEFDFGQAQIVTVQFNTSATSNYLTGILAIGYNEVNRNINISSAIYSSKISVTASASTNVGGQTNSLTYFQSFTFSGGLYTQTGNTLSLYTSYSYTNTINVSGTWTTGSALVVSSSAITGIPISFSLTPNIYWQAGWYSASSTYSYIQSNTLATNSSMFISVSLRISGVIGNTNNSFTNTGILLSGAFSNTFTTAMPNSIHISSIIQSSSYPAISIGLLRSF